MGEHAVHGTCADAGKKTGASHRLDFFDDCGVFPVGLGDNADFEAVMLQIASKQRRRESGMVNIRVTGNKQDIQLVPTLQAHVFTAQRKEFFADFKILPRLNFILFRRKIACFFFHGA